MLIVDGPRLLEQVNGLRHVAAILIAGRLPQLIPSLELIRRQTVAVL